VKLNFLFKEIKMFKVPKKIKYNKGKYTLSFLLLVYHFLLGKAASERAAELEQFWFKNLWFTYIQ